MDEAEISDGEKAVRDYLTMLVEPEKLRDDSRIAEIEGRIAASSDVMEKLRLHTELSQAKLADTSHLVHGFVKHAKAWAATEGIPASAFRDMGVEDSVLADAGLINAPRRGRSRAAASTAKSTVRRGSTNVAEIQKWVKDSTEPFTIAEVAAGLGGSPVTIKKALDQMIAAGEAENLGPAEVHVGPGRAPTMYRSI